MHISRQVEHARKQAQLPLLSILKIMTFPSTLHAHCNIPRCGNQASGLALNDLRVLSIIRTVRRIKLAAFASQAYFHIKIPNYLKLFDIEDRFYN